MAVRSFIKNWQKIYFIDFNQGFDIHKNIINQIVNDYNEDKTDFHVAYVPYEKDYVYDPNNTYSYPDITLPLLHDILKTKLAELGSKMSIEMSIVYNTHSDNSEYTMTFTEYTKKAIKDNGASHDIKIQQYSRKWNTNEIQLENRNVRLGDEGKYIDINDEDEGEGEKESEYTFDSINMFPNVKDSFGGLRAFLSSVAGENNYKNKENNNGGVYYKFKDKFEDKKEYPTIQWNNANFFEHADVPYNKFRVELNIDGKNKKSEESYEFPKSRTAQKLGRMVKTVVRPVKNAANSLKAMFKKTNKAEKAAPAGGKTKKHRKRKMRSSKRKASKKGRKSRKKKSSSRKNK